MKMKLKFELKDNENINIINEEDGRIIGRIFTPSGTSRDIPNAIQICGFSRAFELWGCGVIGDNNSQPTQDIQLLFKDFKSKNDMNGKSFGTRTNNDCWRCFHKKDDAGNCKCSELKIFRRYEDIEKYEKRRKNYENKLKLLRSLE